MAQILSERINPGQIGAHSRIDPLKKKEINKLI